MKMQVAQEFGTALHNLNLLFDDFAIKKTGNPAVDYAFLAICLAEMAQIKTSRSEK